MSENIMSYLTFNEGIFQDIKNRVSTNINNIRQTGSDISGQVLGNVKGVVNSISNSARNLSNNIHNIGNKIGAKGFENPINDINNNTSSIFNKNNSILNGINSIKTNISNRFSLDPSKSSTAIQTAKAYNSLKNLGLAGSQSEIQRVKYEKMKEINKMKRTEDEYNRSMNRERLINNNTN